MVANIYRDDVKRVLSGAKAACGPRRITQITWAGVQSSFEKSRTPVEIAQGDARFLTHGDFEELAEGGGIFCDCEGCGPESAAFVDVDKFDVADMRPLLRRCCRGLLGIPVARSKMIGDFCIHYANAKTTQFQKFWECGVIGATWKCWQCLATEQRRTFADILPTVTQKIHQIPFFHNQNF